MRPKILEMSETPVVSVVIPTYNRAHILCDALDSVLVQSFTDLEVIVVDDASDDGTEIAVHDWRSRNRPPFPIRFIRQARGGGNVARNRGIAEARGEFVAFLDSDDLWHADKIARQVTRLRARPDHGAVYTGLREVELSTGAVLAQHGHRFPEGDLLDALLVSDVTAPTSTYLVRRQVLLDAGCFDPALAARQDWDMWIRVAERTMIACVPEALVDLRLHSGPRTASDPTRELQAYELILKKYQPLRRSRGLKVRLAARASYHRRTGRVHLHYLGRRWRAIRHYLIAILYWPFAVDTWAALIGAALPARLRAVLRRRWNAIFGGTAIGIRSH
ncbi:glycosyltransferase family A protein [Pontibaca salina]|uniref:Glycosyltransferase family 2 protein n=1 Tax=Pontibaca salina TaxID=2795731 RepID=A0A934HL91_9RHOB|nr:glycosyltransferase family 2 protein [Pontibaca salina]MBI6630259.1 glycosyltransferase family 2 protein [Pontibaca salina]